MKNPYRQLRAEGRPELADLGWQRLKTCAHGDLPRWLQAISELPEGNEYANLEGGAPVLGHKVEDQDLLRQLLMNLLP